MAEPNWFGWVVIFVVALTVDSIRQNNKQDKKFKSHTHAADGSINGIRGWY